MKHIIDGVLRLIIAGYSLETLITSGYKPKLLTDSTAESVGSIIGIILGSYILLSFWWHHIVQGIRLLKNKKTKKIKYISIPCILANLLFMFTYISSAIKLVKSDSLYYFTILYILVIGVLIYFTIIDYKIISRKKEKISEEYEIVNNQQEDNN